MQLESCARQFSIRTIALSRRWVYTRTSWNSQAGRICGERRRRVFPDKRLHPRERSSEFVAGYTLFCDEARRLREPPSTTRLFRCPVLPEEENLLHRTFREHACDAISSRLVRLARTSMNLECVTKWVNILATQHQT